MSEWLTLPQWMLSDAADEMQRQRAAELLSLTAAVQIGANTTKPEHARRTLRTWTRAAKEGQARRRLSMSEWQARLAAAGIGIVYEPDGQ